MLSLDLKKDMIQQSIPEIIEAIVVATLKMKPEDYSEDLGAGDVPEWDSMGHVTLLMAVEKHFHFAFDVSDAIEIETVSDLIKAVERYKSTGSSELSDLPCN